MFLAINELLKEKSRFILITAVIVLVSYLVFFLTGLAYGLATSYTKAIDKWDASSVVLSEGANNNIGRSLLFKKDYDQVVGADVAPLGVGVATVEEDGVEDVSLFGINMKSFIVPVPTEGRVATNENEIMVSDELRSIGVVLGGTIKLQGATTEYSVVGVVNDATFQTAPVIYMSLDDWRVAASETSGMIGMRDEATISALVVRGNKDLSSEALAQQSIRDFTFTLPGYQAQVLTFSLMIGFLIGIAALVLAIFIYILTMQKRSIFGVLKAEGVPSSYIGWSVMVQVVILSLCGLLLGMGGAILTGTLLAGKVPFAINPFFFVVISSLFLLCAVVGGVASVRSVSKIDPVEAIG